MKSIHAALPGEPKASERLSVEVQLLCLCARTRMSNSEVRALHSFLEEGDLDWDRFLTLAQWHRLVPLVYWNLCRFTPAGVPVGVLGSLRQEFEWNQRLNMRLVQELWSLIDLFEAAGVEIIPFKGPLQAATIYGNLALRPSGDLDILVRPEQAKASAQILVENGYCMERWSSVFSVRKEQLAHRFDYHSVFFSEAKQVTVEVHWRSSSALLSFPKTTEEIFEASNTVRLAGRSVRTFSPPDLLLFLCIHGCKHGWSRLEWVTGVAECLRTMEDAGLAVSTDVGGAGARRALLLGLSLVERLLKTPLDPSVRDVWQADPAVSRLGTEIEGAIEICVGSGWHYQWKKRTLLFAVCERADERARFLSRVLFRPTRPDIDALSFPESLVWLYALVHPVRQLWIVSVRNFARLARLARFAHNRPRPRP